MQHPRKGVVPQAVRADNFICTVMGTTAITDTFHRVHLHGPELLHTIGDHPTAWARFWFRMEEGTQQRAFTLINARRSAGTFDIDVHVHGGAAGAWARAAARGMTIDAAIQGTGFARPRDRTTHMHLMGDAASIPAMRTILDAFPALPATLWLEQQYDSEVDIPLHARPHDDVVRIPRGDGTAFPSAVQEELSRLHVRGGLENHWFWLACEAAANRALMVHLRGECGVPRSSIAAMAYWKAV